MNTNWIQSYFHRTKAFSVLFSTLAARSHHRPAFSIHSIIHIGHSSPTISWLQSQDYKPVLPVCRSRTPLVEQAFLLLFKFHTSSIHRHHPTLLYRHALILGRLLTFLVAFPTMVFLFSQSLSLHSHLSLPQLGWSPGIITDRCLAVTGGGVLISTADYRVHYNNHSIHNSSYVYITRVMYAVIM